jgi:hypothetical protein
VSRPVLNNQTDLIHSAEFKAGDETWLLQDFVNTPFYTKYRKMKDALAEKITERGENHQYVSHC